jgi:5-methylcytosine-specific restriction endonuclease McrA
MFQKGYKMSESHKQKIREKMIGSKNHRFGKKASEETRKKMTESHIKNGDGKWNKGRKQSLEERQRRTLSCSGKVGKYTRSNEIREKISKSLTGKKQSKKTRKKRMGENCHWWAGGKSYEVYPVDWKIGLKRSIRERDHYRCQLCGEPQGEEALAVHHIDYDKKNCNPDNLICLCRSCHAKTNTNRQNWIKYFKQYL